MCITKLWHVPRGDNSCTSIKRTTHGTLTHTVLVNKYKTIQFVLMRTVNRPNVLKRGLSEYIKMCQVGIKEVLSRQQGLR